jgi:hypothetical protein
MQAEAFEIAITERASANQFDFQIHSLREAIAVPPIEIVENPLTPIANRLGEGLQSFQSTGFDSNQPRLQGGGRGGAVVRRIEPCAEIFFECLALFQDGRNR